MLRKTSKSSFDEIQHYTPTGLQRGVTGSPVMVLVTTFEAPEKPVEISSYKQLWSIVKDKKTFIDRLCHEFIDAFFRLGGRRLILKFIKIENGDKNCGDLYLSEVLGHDRSYVDRSGIYLLRSYESLGDLLAFPQASVLLEKDNLIKFYQKVNELVLSLPMMIALLDAPIHIGTQELKTFSEKLNGSDSALFYPWITLEDGPVAPSVLFLAIFQISDLRNSILGPIANQPLPQDVYPSKVLSIEDVRFLNENRVNVIKKNSSGDFILWGNYTLSSDDETLSSRRTLKAIRESLVKIAEPYVLEHQDTESLRLLEEDFSEFLQELVDFKILYPGLIDNQSFIVNTEINNKKSKYDNGLYIDVQICIEEPGKFIKLQI